VSGEPLLAVLRLAHALAAAVWVGGILAYALSASGSPSLALASPAWRGLREALRIGVGVFLLTGAVLAAERLSSAALPPTYAALLALKIILGLWMFAIARRIGASPGRDPTWWRAPERQVLLIGVVIYALALTLRSIYEQTIRGF
jgi:putative copper export protein